MIQKRNEKKYILNMSVCRSGAKKWKSSYMQNERNGIWASMSYSHQCMSICKIELLNLTCSIDRHENDTGSEQTKSPRKQTAPLYV